MACTSSGGWDGEYRCTESLGETLPDQVAIIEYQLSVDGDSCALGVNGFQISESIKCATIAGKGNLAVTYRSYADGSTTNIYGVAVYTVSEPLFTLKKSPGS